MGIPFNGGLFLNALVWGTVLDNHLSIPSAEKEMKKVLSITLAILCIGTASYYIASPYLVLSKINAALVDKDVDALDAHVDYASIRASLRPVLMSHAKEITEIQEADGMVASFGKRLGQVFFEKQIEEIQVAIVERSLERLVSPEGLSAIMSGAVAIEDINRSTLPLESSPSELFQAAQKEYKGLNVFHVSFERHPNRPVVVILQRRNWTDWMITEINFPSSH